MVKKLVSPQAGFTLIEVLIAMVIFAIVSAAIASQLVNTTAMVSENKGFSQAQALARSYMESLRATPYEDLADSSDQKTIDGQTFNIQWFVDNYEGEDGVKSIRVEVSWSHKGEELSHELDNLYTQVTA